MADSDFVPYDPSAAATPSATPEPAAGSSWDHGFVPYDPEPAPSRPHQPRNIKDILHDIGSQGVQGAPVVGKYMPEAIAAGKAFMHPYLGTGAPGGTYEERKAKNLPEIVGETKSFQEENPKSAALYKAVGATAATAPLFAAASAALPEIGGYGAVPIASRLLAEIGAQGTTGTGINLADRLSREGKITGEDWAKSAAEGYGGATFGTLLGRMLGPGYNYFLRGNKKAVPAINDEMNSVISTDEEALRKSLYGPLKRAGIDPDSIDYTGKLSDAARAQLRQLGEIKTAQNTGRTFSQVEDAAAAGDFSPEIPALVRQMSKEKTAQNIKERFGGDTLHQALTRGVEGGVAGGLIGGPHGAVLGSALDVGAKYMPQVGSWLAHQTAGRHIAQNPISKAMIQELARNSDKYSDIPGVQFENN